MIVEIHGSASSMSRSLRYNEDKVRSGDASVLCTANIDGSSLSEINETFARRERSSVRDLDHVAFHMSVNPGPEDRIGEDDIPHFVNELMEGMGYGAQPWVVFRHRDISRVHYHVVSIRVDGKGRKIRDYFEKKKCERIVASLEERFGYTKGAKGRPHETASGVPVFIPGAEDTLLAIRSCVKDSLSYRFTTERQFAEILRLHGVSVREGMDKNDIKIRLSFQGLDSAGCPCTGSVSEARLGADVQGSIRSRMAECLATDMKNERRTARRSLALAIDTSGSFSEALESLRAQHIDTVVYRDGNGDPRGITLIDHRTRCSFSGSDVSRSLGARLLSMALADHTESAGHESAETAKAFRQHDGPMAGLTDTLRSCLAEMLREPSDRGELTDKDRKRKKKRKR